MTNDPNYVKRTAAVVLGFVLFFVLLFTFLMRMQHDHSLDQRARYDACRTITNERLRRDCIVGPQYQESYAR